MSEIKRLDVYKVCIDKETVPCVVMQGNMGNMYSPTTIVVPLLDSVNDVEDVYCSIETKTLGKKYAVMNKIVTVDQRRLTEFVEKLPETPVLAELKKCYDEFLKNA